ncbi:MAG: hypothetical protein JRF60_00420 [Deltaproteobacteria bacterium]|nr:hypothetical protein [Deltaproteobacteria bacterium]
MNKKICVIMFFIVIMLLPLNVYSIDLTGPGSLTGIESMGLVIQFKEIGNLTKKQIKDDVKLKLLKSNIKVVNSSNNYLHVEASAFKEDDIGIVIYKIKISFIQDTEITRNNMFFPSITWCNGNFGILDIDAVQNIRDSVKDFLNLFILDYLKANPVK